jgi:N-acetylglucosaminyl-diphospho-decaprenol L-rhamnosyltransferase
VTRPELSTIVVAWRAADDVAELVASWPRDRRFELVIVDQVGDCAARLRTAASVSGASGANGASGVSETLPENVRLLNPGRNLGFAGGSNFGARAAGAELLLFLNPDARPGGEEIPALGALTALVEAFAGWPQATGLVPRLIGFDGVAQTGWQLRRLPAPLALLAHALFWNPGTGDRTEPPAGTAIEQPAAAALALRRSVFESLGGFDEAFFPAWFEDVDLARRLAGGGHSLLYLPAALFRHRQGSSVSALGYGAFLTAYDRNLCRYLAKHHGQAWALAFRALAGPAALLRLLLLPLRRPARAASRREAASALLSVARGSLTGWSGGAPVLRDGQDSTESLAPRRGGESRT